MLRLPLRPRRIALLAALGAISLTLVACPMPGQTPSSGPIGGSGPGGTSSTSAFLDAAFGENGVVTTDLQPDMDDLAYAIAVQADGKIVLAGTSGTPALTRTALVRYTADGEVDPHFGTDGLVLDTKSVSASSYGLAVQSDGKLVTGGWSSKSDSSTDFLLTRFSAAGELDAEFGDGGHAGLGLNTAFGNAMAQQSDGKLLLAGQTTNFMAPAALVARFTQNGALDASWGDEGVARLDWGTDYDNAKAIAVLPDGKVLVAGKTDAHGVVLTRLTADGALDGSFGRDGLVKRDLGEGNAVRAIALGANGRILLVGGSKIHAYDADGSVDETFGENGSVSFPGHALNALVELPDGSVMAVGKDAKSVAVVKVTAQGKGDGTFGKAGALSLVEAVPSGEAFHVLRLATGKLLIAGKAFDEDDDFLLLRLKP